MALYSGSGGTMGEEGCNMVRAASCLLASDGSDSGFVALYVDSVMYVVTPDQARVVEKAGACTVMALECVPADIRAQATTRR